MERDAPSRRRVANLTLDEVRACVIELLREGGSPSEVEIRRRLGGAPATILNLRRQVFDELLAAVDGERGHSEAIEPNPLELNARELWARAEILAAEKYNADRERLLLTTQEANNRAAAATQLSDEIQKSASEASFGYEKALADLMERLSDTEQVSAARLQQVDRLSALLPKLIRHHARRRKRWQSAYEQSIARLSSQEQQIERLASDLGEARKIHGAHLVASAERDAWMQAEVARARTSADSAAKQLAETAAALTESRVLLGGLQESYAAMKAERDAFAQRAAALEREIADLRREYQSATALFAREALDAGAHTRIREAAIAESNTAALEALVQQIEGLGQRLNEVLGLANDLDHRGRK